MSIRSSIFIRRAERDDLDSIVEWMEDPDFLLFLYGDPVRSSKRLRENIISLLGRSPGSSMPSGVYFLIDSAEHGPIGFIGLQNISWRNRSCTLDTYIGNKKMRNGIVAVIALLRALEFAFYELNLHRVAMLVYSFNTASWRIVERAGAVREMTLRDHVLRAGQFHDMYCYGMLRDEFDTLLREARERFPEATLEYNIKAYGQAVVEQEKRA